MNIILEFWKPALSSFLIGVLLVKFAVIFFPKWGLLDRPHKYGLKRSPIPYYGGLAIFTAFLLSIFLYVPLSNEIIGLISAATIIVLTGFLDDYFNLSPFLRIFVQFVACLVLVYFGIGILSINLPFLGAIDFSSPEIFGVMILSAIFTIFWVITILNTMNFVDGIGGLSSGVSFIAGMTIFFLSINPTLHENPETQIGVATIALILAMVSLAFLLFDFPHPQILMGDSGSTFLGFMIAVLAIFSGGKVATAFLVLGIPILDMVWVVLRRFFSGQKIWRGDQKHLHHRLMEWGFSTRRVVLMYLLITSLLGGASVMLVSGQQKFFMLIGLVLLMIILASALVFMPKGK
jgi:UDP-GlcNAc:undecaprenyl-phosphate/decaprenyl-phosphate GlcNAc-1-phosphate transferase